MSIDWYRDLFICICGVVATGVLIFVAVLWYSLYRRIKPILDSIKATSTTVQEISFYVGREVAKPMIQMAALIQGIREGVNAVSKLFDWKGGRHG